MSLTNKVAQFDIDSDLVNAWVNGPATGVGSTITTDSGEVSTPAKLIKDKSDAIDNALEGIAPFTYGYQHSNTVWLNSVIQDNCNVISGGPLTVVDGVTVTVPSSSVWTIV